MVKNKLKYNYLLTLFCSLLSSVIYCEPIKKLPKAELHLHLTGSYPLSYLQKIASNSALHKEYKDFVSGLNNLAKRNVSYHEAFKYFLLVEKLVNTYKKVEDGVIALGEELIKDGVIYAEIRTGLKDLGKGHEEYLKAVLRGIDRCPKNLKLKLIISLRRNTGSAVAKNMVDLAIHYKNQGIIGIDVSGDSTLGDIAEIIPELQRAKKASLYLTLHLGESPREIDTIEKELEQVKILEQLNPDRIGHGVFLAHPAIQWILKNSTPIEVCPTSSIIAGMINRLNEHPWIEYHLTYKHPIIIGTDDPLLFKTTLSAEYNKLLNLQKINRDIVNNIIRSSFEFAFLPQQEKTDLLLTFQNEKSRT